MVDEGIECEWQERGLLFVYDDVEGFEGYADTDRMLREEFGVGATPYDGERVLELEPSLKPGVAGAWHYEGDCHLRPDKLMAELRSRLVARKTMASWLASCMRSWWSSASRMRRR